MIKRRNEFEHDNMTKRYTHSVHEYLVSKNLKPEVWCVSLDCCFLKLLKCLDIS